MRLLAFFLFCLLCGTAAALGIACRRLRQQERKMEEAAARIREYLLDRRRGGMECNEEGAMYHLFHELNSLVAIADAHADSERQGREFLQNTISDISHQLKTPIAALNLYNGILQQEAENAAAVKEFTGLFEQELDRMESLVQSLLKMARLDAGAVVLEQSPENIAELLEHVKAHYSFRARQEGKEIALMGDEQAVLLCDRVWLSEAIGNLVKNALDHTARGDQILLRWQQSSCLTAIVVEDTGSGIHPEDLYHIFKRFYRSRFSKDTRGIGLGLPLAKSIVEAHQGSIEVHSRLGCGTSFAVHFPMMTK
ncbi:MAG: HAMP domain-containing histidine kinase [Provencibacterium sp.]|jgi:signal transduction histidine kinase|nr:HAMP domain-containing histidine kinase [Provencibacterium sp.]